MSWGCKPENKPAGCRWADRTIYTWGDEQVEDWWCDLCERAGEVVTPLVSDAGRSTGGES